jgi:hypothetical protein
LRDDIVSWYLCQFFVLLVFGGARQKRTLDDGHNGALLDGRGALETVGVDPTEKLSLQRHVVEGVRGLIVVGLDLACGGVLDRAQKVLV